MTGSREVTPLSVTIEANGDEVLVGVDRENVSLSLSANADASLQDVDAALDDLGDELEHLLSARGWA
ncbi:hypothetical protein VB773_14295 [Haloarculaceae archaeon H-GB2-1]|nr:hypothetical protein [Haloarculaceae archaeon H-GB1-1]MEA5408626.1 hypothetical protein [Haloarculaceae archaeon H-GB2-1]